MRFEDRLRALIADQDTPLPWAVNFDGEPTGDTHLIVALVNSAEAVADLVEWTREVVRVVAPGGYRDRGTRILARLDGEEA